MSDVTANTVEHGLISVRPVLYWPPTFWHRDDWAESARGYEWVSPSAPLSERPSLEFQVPIDITLGEVLETSLDAWGIVEGPNMIRHGRLRRHELCRYGFVRVPDDESGVDERVGYAWPSRLPVVQDDGTIEKIYAYEVTFRELLISSELDLIAGDVKRPYVYPKSPQGIIHDLILAPQFSEEMLHAAIAKVNELGGDAVRTARQVVANTERADNTVLEVTGNVGLILSIRKWLRKLKRQDKDLP